MRAQTSSPTLLSLFPPFPPFAIFLLSYNFGSLLTATWVGKHWAASGTNPRLKLNSGTANAKMAKFGTLNDVCTEASPTWANILTREVARFHSQHWQTHRDAPVAWLRLCRTYTGTAG